MNILFQVNESQMIPELFWRTAQDFQAWSDSGYVWSQRNLVREITYQTEGSQKAAFYLDFWFYFRVKE